MNSHEKATQRRIQGIQEALQDGVECPQREQTGKVVYCRNEGLAEKAGCPHLGSETVPVCIDKPSQEREDYILKKTKVKPTGPRESVPSHMAEKHVCKYKLFE
ncbi:hypothetical protein KY338_07100 [Candidatus Woesearchaeota archaeon]|nr:hypothetical protein [Candidatus Woesearchaeota archaeon]MBW3005832.1 hypothetical protein [Candidatus Woesearchaeota archaeon]